jgi:hypothetical protein
LTAALGAHYRRWVSRIAALSEVMKKPSSAGVSSPLVGPNDAQQHTRTRRSL